MSETPDMAARARCLSATPKHVCCEVEGEAVILHLQTGVYFGLDGVGKRLWELLQSPVTIDNLVATVQREYEVDPEACRQDVERFVEELSRHDLVELRDP
jgi:hypothetical protein